MGGISFEIIILLVLAVIVFWRLMAEFGKRDGYEPERSLAPKEKPAKTKPVAVPVADVDVDPAYQDAIAKAQLREPDFTVSKFLLGAKSAYEMVLMAYLNGDMRSVKSFVDADVYAGFEAAIQERAKQGHKIDAEFCGINDVKLHLAEFDDATGELELGVEFIAQIKQQVVDADGTVIEGDKSKIETEHDIWFFARKMGADDPNWELVATDA